MLVSVNIYFLYLNLRDFTFKNYIDFLNIFVNLLQKKKKDKIYFLFGICQKKNKTNFHQEQTNENCKRNLKI